MNSASLINDKFILNDEHFKKHGFKKQNVLGNSIFYKKETEDKIFEIQYNVNVYHKKFENNISLRMVRLIPDEKKQRWETCLSRMLIKKERDLSFYLNGCLQYRT